MKARLIAILIVPIFVLTLSAAAFAKDKVGYLDVQRIVSQSNLGKEARAELDKFRDSRNKQITERRTQLEGLVGAIQQERQKKSPDRVKFAQLVERAQNQKKSLERFAEDVNAELVKRDKVLVAKILRDASSVVKDIAKKQGYSVILRNAQDIAYLNPDANITDDVVKELNKRSKK